MSENQGSDNIYMKVVFATGIYPPEIGGPAGYVKGVATELANQSHEVSVVTYGDDPELNSKYQIANIKRGNSVLVRYIKYAYQTWKLARKSDLIYVQGPVSEGLPATIASLFSRKPLVLKVVGDYAWEQYQQTGTNYESARITNGIKDDPAKYEIRNTKYELLDDFVAHRHKGKIWLMEAVERWVASRAEQIIVPSKYLKSIVEKWGVEPDKIKVIYNSISPLPDVVSREELRKKNDLGDKIMLFTAGRAIALKRVDFILEVLASLPTNYVLAVAGDGPMIETWKEKAAALNLKDRVAWLGHLNKVELAKFYKMADLFLLASSHETAPHVLLEAASIGLKCIASDKGGIPEIAEQYPRIIKIVPYDDKNSWATSIKTRASEKSSDYKQPTNSNTYDHMVKETLESLQSQICITKNKLQSEQTDIRVDVLSIGTEKQLFFPGKVRDRIVSQAKDFQHLTILVFAKQKFDEQIAPNVRVISTNSWNKFFYVTDALLKIWKLRKEKFAVITSQDPTETGLVAYLASKFLKTALAIQDHGYHFHGSYYRQESWLNQLRYLFARFLVARADAIRVVSQRTEDALIKLGIAKDKIIRFSLTLDSKFLVSNSSSSSVNSDQWTVTDDAQGSARYEIRDTRYYLVVCRFVPIKRIDLAIHAFSIIAKQNSDVKLKIVGSGPLESQIKQWIVDFDLQNKVEIIPWTDNLAALYREAIATLITSDREGYGMTAVESLACGTPVIMTDVGCAGEVVKNGENGIIVPVGDVVALANAMEQLIQCQMPNAKCQIIEAFGINNFRQTEAEGLGVESKFVVRSSRFASTASMSDFLLSAISRRLSAKKKEDEDFWRFSESEQGNQLDNTRNTMMNSQNTEPKASMLFLTQKINQNDDDLAFVILWVKEFIKQGVDVKVICLEKGAFDDSFPVYSLGKEKGFGKFRRILEFYKLIFKLKYNRVFVHMNPEYTTLGGWFWFLKRAPIYLWYTHYTMHIHLFLTGILSSRMFAATKQSLPQYDDSPKKVILGHGIDIDFWLKGTEIDRGSDDETKYNLLTVHRLCRSKRLELGILALKYLPEKYNLTIYGRDVEKEYVEELKALVTKESLESRVKFMGPVPMHELKQVYPKHRLMVNMASETIDKTMVEAMLFGIYPVTTKGNSEAIGLPAFINLDDPKEMADFILAEKWKNYDVSYLRDIIKTKHSLPALIANMNKYIKPGN